ncbi:YraN family protein [Janibacter anophelis]|uniref:YraN family protein n=1 Tax=Janibacter anophelis TaxID=319054 RepID=UPI000DEFCA2C|nr:YraN family protein [Janibacter anophelis]
MTRTRTDEQEPTRAGVGAEGEAFAEQYLVARGMQVLARNWRCSTGEIDLVLRDGDEIVVCEVKTRRSRAFGEPIEAITRAKLRRLRRLAGRWLAEHEVSARGVRIDVVALHRDHTDTYSVEHVPGVGQ